MGGSVGCLCILVVQLQAASFGNLLGNKTPLLRLITLAEFKTLRLDSTARTIVSCFTERKGNK